MGEPSTQFSVCWSSMIEHSAVETLVGYDASVVGSPLGGLPKIKHILIEVLLAGYHCVFQGARLSIPILPF